jgi:hypothetical protein
MVKQLYLDDLRMPHQSGYVDSEWTIVRNLEDFKKHVLTYGVPNIVSFDHDLGENAQGNELPSGYDAVKWLSNFDQKFSRTPGNWEIRVHSANPVGRENILGYYNSYKKFLFNQ